MNSILLYHSYNLCLCRRCSPARRRRESFCSARIPRRESGGRKGAQAPPSPDKSRTATPFSDDIREWKRVNLAASATSKQLSSSISSSSISSFSDEAATEASHGRKS